VNPFQCYTTFLALKQHFSKPSYDVIKYNWKTRASLTAFNKRTDRYFYERLSRKKSEQEIKNYFIANFVSRDNPQSVYITDLIKDGEETYIEWMKRVQSLSYLFESEASVFISKDGFNELFECKNKQHSPLIHKHLQKALSIETLVILDKILHYVEDYDRVLDDPMWDSLRMKIVKYSPLLNIDTKKYSKILKEIVSE
jgi:hypothetical protein